MPLDSALVPPQARIAAIEFVPVIRTRSGALPQRPEELLPR